MHKMVMGIFVMFIASSATAQAPLVATDITAAQVQAWRSTVGRTQKRTEVLDPESLRRYVRFRVRSLVTPPK